MQDNIWGPQIEANMSHPTANTSFHALQCMSSLCNDHHSEGPGSHSQNKNIMIDFCNSPYILALLMYNKILLCFCYYSAFILSDFSCSQLSAIPLTNKICAPAHAICSTECQHVHLTLNFLDNLLTTNKFPS